MISLVLVFHRLVFIRTNEQQKNIKHTFNIFQFLKIQI